MKSWGREIHGPSQGAEVAARLARRHVRPTARLRRWKVPALRPPGPRRFGRASAPAYLPGPVQVHLPLAGSRIPPSPALTPKDLPVGLTFSLPCPGASSSPGRRPAAPPAPLGAAPPACEAGGCA